LGVFKKKRTTRDIKEMHVSESKRFTTKRGAHKPRIKENCRPLCHSKPPVPRTRFKKKNGVKKIRELSRSKTIVDVELPGGSQGTNRKRWGVRRCRSSGVPPRVGVKNALVLFLGGGGGGGGGGLKFIITRWFTVAIRVAVQKRMGVGSAKWVNRAE